MGRCRWGPSSPSELIQWLPVLPEQIPSPVPHGRRIPSAFRALKASSGCQGAFLVPEERARGLQGLQQAGSFPGLGERQEAEQRALGHHGSRAGRGARGPPGGRDFCPEAPPGRGSSWAGIWGSGLHKPHLAVLCEPLLRSLGRNKLHSRDFGVWRLGWVSRTRHPKATPQRGRQAAVPIPTSKQRLFCFPTAVTSARGGSFLAGGVRSALGAGLTTPPPFE